MNLAIAGTKASAALSINLKQNFKVGSAALMGELLKKYKEKRPMILIEVDKYCEAQLNVGNLEDFGAAIAPAIINVAPGVKTGTLKFVDKMVPVTYVDVLKRAAPELLPNIKKALDDKDAGVRDAACNTMGLFKARLPEDMLKAHLKDLVKQKMDKIEEAAK